MRPATLSLRLLVFVWGVAFLALSLLYLLSDLPILLALALRQRGSPVELVVALIWPAGVSLGITIIRVALRPLPGSAIVLPEEPFEVRRDRPLHLALATFGVLSASVCLAITAIPAIPGWLGGGCAMAAGAVLWLAARLLWTALRRPVALVLDARGVRAPGRFDRPIPWDRIREARILPSATGNLPPVFLALGLRPPGARPEVARPGLLARLLGAEDACLDLSMLDVDPEQLLAFVRARLPPRTDPG